MVVATSHTRVYQVPARWYYSSTGRRLQTVSYDRLRTTTSRGSGECSNGGWGLGSIEVRGAMG